MKLHTGRLFWPDVSGDVAGSDEPASGSTAFDVVIVGAGMSGMLCAYRLAKAGYGVLVVERDRVGAGSTAANTGLIQYMSDAGVHEYAKQIGKENAEIFYEWSHDAVDTLQDMISEVKEPDVRISESTDSLLVATDMKSRAYLKHEKTAQEALGFDVELFSQSELGAEHINGMAALSTSPDIALNPYAFVHRLAITARSTFNLKIMENCRFVSYRKNPAGGLSISLLLNGKRHRIWSPRLIVCTGYDTPRTMSRKLPLMEHYRTFVVVTEAIGSKKSLLPAMVWEKKDAYTYVRNTFDRRLMIGGLDEKGKTLSEDDAEKNQAKLMHFAASLLSDTTLKPPAYSYAAIFGESKDNLPYMGLDPASDDVMIIAGLGGNGTVYSVIGSDIALHWMRGRMPEGASLFKIDR